MAGHSKNTLTTDKRIDNPFPGLRPFSIDEAHLFFGRKGQVDEISGSLSSNHFVAVVGSSGSGKSSLIYCGVIPTLMNGNLKSKTSDWNLVTTRPGNTPLTNLIKDIKLGLDIKEEVSNPSQLFSNDNGVLNFMSKSAHKGNVLIMIDQFEEVFRFGKVLGKSGIKEDPNLYIDFLVHAVKQTKHPVYLVITMRSDFIGECSQFQEFTKLINKSNYLVPRMTATDFQDVIEGPVKVAGASIDEKLVRKLLEDIGDNPDQLPVLQHVLMRTWEYWSSHNDLSKPITNSDYEAVGMIEKALSEHANEAFDELDEREKQICESIFRTLTEKGGDNRGVRRPTKVRQLAEISQSSVEEVIRIVNVFRAHGRSFLVPSYKTDIDEDSVIDITHESFMRIWERLRVWVDEEAAAVLMYKRLAESAAQYQQGKTSLWRPPDLQLAVNWKLKTNPSLAWAERHDPAFERTIVFLNTSEKEFQKEEENKIRLQKRALRNTRIFALVLGSAAIVAMGLFLYTQKLQQQTEQSKNEAIKSKELADNSATLAQQQKELADLKAKEALLEKNKADSAKQVADEQKILAVSANQLAQEQKLKADSNAVEATKQSQIAMAESKRAFEQQQKADSARKEADRRKIISIAQSMAVKSEQMRTDTLLKGLLAFQSYSFNSENDGVVYDPDIFKSAYSGLKFFEGADFNNYKGHKETVRTIVQDKDRLISGSSDGQVISWNLGKKDSSLILSLPDLTIIKKLVLSDQILFCLTNKSIIRYALSNKISDVYNLQNVDIKDFFITKNGKYLIVLNQAIIITDDYKKPGIEFYKTDVKINAVKYELNTADLFVALSDGKIIYWKNLQSEQEKPAQLANIPDANWGDISFNPRKNIVAAGTGNNQGAIYLWNISNGQQISSLRGHTAKITGISFSPDGSLMATASYDASVRLWHMEDLNTLPIVFDDHGYWVTSVIFTNDGKYVISGDRTGIIRRYPTEIKTLINSYCNFLSRDLTESEWQIYVGAEIPYKPTKCINR